jgi:hypothetical protein
MKSTEEKIELEPDKYITFSEAVQSGVPIGDVARFLGVSGPQTTKNADGTFTHTFGPSTPDRPDPLVR